MRCPVASVSALPLGRAIVRKPAAFLFDEPLSNLDAKLRVSMRGEIKRLQRRLGTTSLYVTHDQLEAMTLADRLVDFERRADRADRHAAESTTRRPPRLSQSFIGSPAMNLVSGELHGDRLAIAHPSSISRALRRPPALSLSAFAQKICGLPVPVKTACRSESINIEELGSAARLVHGTLVIRR